MHMKRAEVLVIIIIILLSFFAGCIFPEENIPPEANLSASSTYINVDEEITLSANDSFDEDGEIVRYYWDFDDGSNATGKVVTHTYEKGGNYTVILIVTDNDNKKAVQAMTIHVNELPEANIIVSSPAYIHETVYFWANGTYDPDGFIKDYFWDFGDGENDTGESVSHIYTEKRPFQVTLTVTDNDGAKNATTRVFLIQYRTYKVVWRTDTYEVLRESSGLLSPLLEEDSEIISLPISVLNITILTFELTWDDERPSITGDPNDLFSFNITSPDGDYYVDSSTLEKITIYAPDKGIMNEIPENIESIEAESSWHLEKQLALNHTGKNGLGNWEINITLEDAWGRTLDVQDNLNHWNLTVVCRYYWPVITRN
ncbi:MAG: PKD domain-containing protein [Thermoplasmata archaeon]|nr:MAG: PKD domain-containing protein [Thermoplasmata archaeon]